MRTITRARASTLALFVAFGAFTPGLAQGQTTVITGQVTSEAGQVLEGANVFIPELTLSVTTNATGAYTITIPPARVSGQLVNLRVRAVGYQPQVRPVRLTTGSQTFNFVMRQDVNRLDEIVVTGTIEGVERSKVPFAVGRLTTEDMPVPALDPLRQLAGKVAGMRIAQTGGRPGSSPEIMMRGPKSINASGRGQGPLIIIDGTIMNVGSIEELGAMDIESVEVVKGAAGASLYGTRAANGVISIKTKRGSANEGIRFNTRSEFGISDLNSVDYSMPENHHLTLDETGKRFCEVGASNVPNCSRSFDWMTEIMRVNNVPSDTTRVPRSSLYGNVTSNANYNLQNLYQASIWPNQYYVPLAQALALNPIALQHVDASGRLGRVRFYTSGEHQVEEGAIKHLNGYRQTRARVNVDYDLREDLLVSVSSMYALGANDLRSGGSYNGSIFGQAMRGASPGTNFAAFDTLGRPIITTGGSPLRGTGNGGGSFMYDQYNDMWYDFRNNNRLIGNINASYFPADWITFDGTFAYDRRDRQDVFRVKKGYRSDGKYGPDPDYNFGRMSLSDRRQESWNASLTSTMRHQLRSDLHGKLTLRGLYDEDDVRTDFGSGTQFLVKDIYTLQNTAENQTVSSGASTIKNVGALAGTTLDYKDRYILDATYRYDGSSLFGAGNRWAPFGRISGVWRVSEEPFWNLGWLSDFRLRASRGTAGSTPRFDAQYETYSVTTSGIFLGQAGNSKLKPETTTETEAGTDLTLFDRLGVEFTYAHAITDDQILLVNTPGSLGFSTQWQNAGALRNNTVEVGLNLPVITRANLQWTMRATWDRNRTYIDRLDVPEFVFTAGTGAGTGGFFRITDSTQYRLPQTFYPDGTPTPNSGRSLTNGFAANRYGNIWGRKFIRNCSELRFNVAAYGGCGDGMAFQVNDEGYVVWVGAGNSWRDGITRNLWQTVLPGTQSPFGDRVPLYFGMPIVDRPLRGEPNEGIGIRQVVGNVFPDFRFTYSNNVQYKRFAVYALLDATIGHDVYNQGFQWGLFDFNNAAFDRADNSVETAKPLGYMWRAAAEFPGIGGFYDVLGPNSRSVQDASFMKAREVSLTYHVGPVRSIGDWTVGFTGRNLFTITNYPGYDPEVGVSGGSTGSGLINQVDNFDFPTLRSYTLTLTSRF